MKAVIVGDNMLTAEMFLSRSAPLHAAGYEILTWEWLSSNRTEMQRRNLAIELYGPEVEPPVPGLIEAVRDADLLLTHLAPVPAAIVEAGPRLAAIGVARAGWENVNSAAATRCGIPVVNVLGRNANAVAEFTLGLILSEMRNIARSHALMSRGEWFTQLDTSNLSLELAHKTVGLVGFGAIGRTVARRLAGFEVRLLVSDPAVLDAEIRAFGCEPVSLETLLREADIVSLHARLIPATEGLIGRRELALMKPSAYLVNTARAGLIDETALYEALAGRQIAGAALDVFWTEPLPAGSPWLRLDNLTMASHLAGTTEDAFYTSVELLVDNVLAFLQRGVVDRVVNPEVLGRR